MSKTKCMILAALFAALTAIGAFVQIPFGITSITLQVLFTNLAGLLLGAKWGALSQLVYVGLGLMGLPVFTQGGGLGYLLRPSMGFLLGLVPAAWIVGKLTETRRTPCRVIAACLAGLGVLYLVGIPYMYGVLNWYLKTDMSLWTVLWSGMLVYLPGDAVKITVIAVVSKPMLRAAGRA